MKSRSRISWRLDARPEPAILVPPRDAASLDEAHAAIELWEYYSGKTLDPTQCLAVEIMMAVDAAGRWAAETTGREMPRQNGKGDEIEVVEFWGLVQRSEAILHTIHDAVLLADQTQGRMLRLFDHRDLRPKLARVWKGSGQQMIELRSGGVIWYRTRTGGGGRGIDDVDRVVMDEAQHATSEHAEAVTPTLLANANPQLNVIGTGGIEGKSGWWWQQRRRALSPDPGRYGYIGHTAEHPYIDATGRVVQPPVDVEDREVWLSANPSVAVGRGRGMVFLEEQFRRLGAPGFAREHLCVWDPDPGFGVETVWPADSWDACCSLDVTPDVGLVFAVDVHPDRTSASIGVGDISGRCELVDHRPGVGWVVDRVTEVALPRGSRVVVQGAGPAGSLIVDLERAGLTVIPASGVDVRAACGAFYDAIAGKTARIRRKLKLDQAAAAAVKKPSGDAWVFDRRQGGDITPLYAVVLARWAAAVPADPHLIFAF